MITPLSIPLASKPFEYELDVPVVGVVLIQKGWPDALILNLYVKPLSKFIVGFDVLSIV